MSAKIEDALGGFADERTFGRGVYGCWVRRARGRGQTRFAATNNPKP